MLWLQAYHQWIDCTTRGAEAGNLVSSEDDFDEMAEACLEAARLIERHGSPELRNAMRIALFILGREIAQAEMDQGRAGDGHADGAGRFVDGDDGCGR